MYPYLNLMDLMDLMHAVAGLWFVSDASGACRCRIEIRDHHTNNNIPLMLNSYHSKRLNPGFAFPRFCFSVPIQLFGQTLPP